MKALEESGRDATREKHIPEFLQVLPRLEAFYHKAVLREPAKKDAVSKIIAQIKDVFAKKEMSLWKWNVFHLQLNALFSDPQKSIYYKTLEPSMRKYAVAASADRALDQWGRLDFQKLAKRYENIPKSIDGFLYFIYDEDGTLGVRALNFAFMNKMSVLAITTNHNFDAHNGQILTPHMFAQHDLDHYKVFTHSVWWEKLDLFKKIYHLIMKQKDPLVRAQDQVALFLLTHEYYVPLKYSVYAKGGDISFSEIIDLSQLEIFSHHMAPKLESHANRKAIHKVFEEVFTYSSIQVKNLGNNVYEVSGERKATPTKFLKGIPKIKPNIPNVKETYRVRLTAEDKILRLSYVDAKGNEVNQYGKTYRSILSDNYDIIGLLQSVGVAVPDASQPKEVIDCVFDFIERFQKKYEIKIKD